MAPSNQSIRTATHAPQAMRQGPKHKTQGMEFIIQLLWRNPELQCFIQYDWKLQGLYIVWLNIWLKAGGGLAPSQGGSIRSPPQRGVWTSKHCCGLILFHYTHSHSKTHGLICHLHHIPTPVACLMDLTLQLLLLLSGFSFMMERWHKVEGPATAHSWTIAKSVM